MFIEFAMFLDAHFGKFKLPRSDVHYQHVRKCTCYCILIRIY